MTPSWIESRAQEGGRDVFFDAPWSLGVAPADPNICYATDLFRTYRTLDGGLTWETVNSVRVGDDSWTTRGLDVTTNYGVHFDPFDARHLIISYTDIGAFQSHDGGASWTSATNGVPTAWRNTTYWVVFDPKVKGRLWGAFSGTHDLPRPKMWRHRDTQTFTGGVGVSTDGGKTWPPSNQGMPSTSVTHLLLDPASPAASRTLYACGFGTGVYKSTDGGKSWTLKNRVSKARLPSPGGSPAPMTARSISWWRAAARVTTAQAAMARCTAPATRRNTGKRSVFPRASTVRHLSLSTRATRRACTSPHGVGAAPASTPAEASS